MKPDPEQYLDFHFGKKTEYTRPHTLLAMVGFCTETVQTMTSKALAAKARESKPKTRPGSFDPLWATASRIKISWFIDKKITSEQYDRLPSYDIFYLLKMGIPESKITPERVLHGISSARWDILNKRHNKN